MYDFISSTVIASTVMFKAQTPKALELVREYEPTEDFICMDQKHVPEFCQMMVERKLTWIRG